MTLVVRKFDPKLPVEQRERIAGADVRLVILLKPIFGPFQSFYFKKVTDPQGECHFNFDVEGFEELQWACEVVKRYPDGKIYCDIGMPARGKVSEIPKLRNIIKTLTLSVGAWDIDAKEWPFFVDPSEASFPEEEPVPVPPDEVPTD